MTLARQLLIGIIVAFVALLLGIEAIYVGYARRSLERQLDAHANETATSLALTMGSRMQSLDVVLVNTIVNPVFDRGHFDSIEIRALDGKLAFGRRLDRQEIDVPDWFEAVVAFEPPVGRALVTAGWLQLGRVSVKVHPKFAYEQLWNTALATLGWLSLMFAGALVGIRIYLAGILKPLHLIEQAANAIGDRNFVSVETEPRARELLSVTRAINSLSAKIRDAMRQETERADRLSREAFEDAATGVLNRRGFENALASLLGKGGEVHSGALAIFALEGLQDVNQAVGIAKGNEVLASLATALAAARLPDAPLVGRWQGPAFAAFVPNTGREEVASWAGGLSGSFAASLHSAGLPTNVAVRAGIAHFQSGSASIATLGQLAEKALAEAVARSSGAVILTVEQGAGAFVDVKGQIESALAAGRISLLFQKVISVPDGDLLQFELFSQLTDQDGAVIPAAAYIPVASQHGLLPAVDRRVAQLALETLARSKTLPYTVSINVASQSLLDSGYREELVKLLKAHPREARRLAFEMTGASASRSPDVTKRFAIELRRAGSRLALDNFEMNRDAIALVNDMMPAYVKLAAAFTREIGEREDARFILEAMLRVFQPLEVPVIASGVENEAMVAALSELRISGYQGYVLGKPAPLAD